MVASNAMAVEIKVHSHLVAPAGAQVGEAEPGSLPTAAHPEGTVFAIAYPKGVSRPLLAEVDVASSAIVRRASLSCDTILRAGTRLFANCENELVAFDSALNVLWRSPIGGCPEASPRVGHKLFFDGASRLVEADSCGNELYLRVASSEYGTLFANVETGLGALRDWLGVQIYFHGTAILGVWSQAMPGIPTPVFALSSDYTRISTMLMLSRGEGAWDDGTHVHVSQDAEAQAWFADGQGRSRLKWLVPDRDYALSDSLAPLGWTPMKEREPTPDYLIGDVMSGGYIAYEFDQGPQHFWLARGCCGSGGGGLYVGNRITSQSVLYPLIDHAESHTRL